MAEPERIEDVITTQDLRQRVGEVFSRVQYANRPLTVKKQGRNVGIIVPAEWSDDIHELQEKRNRAQAVAILAKGAKRRIKAGKKESEEEVADLARELLQEVRAAKRKGKRTGR